MRARRLASTAVGTLTPDELVGAILLAPLSLPDGTLPKGTRLEPAHAARMIAAAAGGGLADPVRLAWADPGDLHEDEAARRLAAAIGGDGVEARAPRQSRLDLVARRDGVLHVRPDGLARVNAIDPLEVFTLYTGQAVSAGQVVASVKVAPHLVPESAVAEAVRLAGAGGTLVEVRPYVPLEVGAIAEETMTPGSLARFEAGARMKVEALGSRFTGTVVVGERDPAAAEHGSRDALVALAVERRLPVILVGGVSAGDPLSPFFAALERLGGEVLRRGVPAHPGSMIWLARLEATRLLGLPSCGMFSLATAADLVLPRLLTGETLDAADLADLGHGGILNRDMRFRFPAYARDLPAPEG
ncbi:MAG TPA: hypothetical protein VMN37_11510 [Gemmatimonadales bacterium]|nr:hypothetical protein [Gemmatimonadales bacterium]